FGDVDGDGLIDVIAADPETSRLLVFRQRRGGGLDLGSGFPSLASIEILVGGDFNHDGNVELILYSSSEKLLGVTEWDGHRLTFPTPLPVEGLLAAATVAELNGDGIPDLVLLLRDGKGRASTYRLSVLRRGEDGTWFVDPRLS